MRISKETTSEKLKSSRLEGISKTQSYESDLYAYILEEIKVGVGLVGRCIKNLSCHEFR